MTQPPNSDLVGLDERIRQLRDEYPDRLYFAITLTADDLGRIIFGTPTQWAGWANEDRHEELRRTCPVYPTYAVNWEICGEPYAIVHTIDEMTLFLLSGGNALVEEGLGRTIFHDLLGAERSIHCGVEGFVSPSFLAQTAFRQAYVEDKYAGSQAGSISM
jgi:hypothetical protein